MEIAKKKNSLMAIFKDSSRKNRIWKIAIIGVLIALTVVLNVFGRFIIAFPIVGPIRFSFSIVIIYAIGFIVNPIAGFFIGMLVDIVSFFLSGTAGIFHIGFSINSGISCSLAGIVAYLSKNHYKYNKNFYRNELIYFTFAFLIIASQTALLAFIPIAGVAPWISGVSAIVSSLVLLGILSLIIFTKARWNSYLFLLIILDSFISSILSSIWLEQLLDIPFNILLWPRTLKNNTLQWWIFLLLLIPIFKILKGKNYLWWQKG